MDIRVLGLENGMESLISDGVQIQHTVSKNIHTVTLTAQKTGVRPIALEVELPVPAALLLPADQLYIYDEGTYTNEFTNVLSYAQAENHIFSQLAVFKNLKNGRVYLAGFLTLQRFWASMLLHNNRLTVRFELECRELVVGEPYVMERLMLAEGHDNENALLDEYADLVAALNNAIPTGDLPVGWCSWSCYYSDVNEERIRRAADAQVAYAPNGVPNLIQIDDGWQRGGSFSGGWETDEKKFPSGMPAMAKYVAERGMVFGLWLAPCLLDETSEYYNVYKHLAMPDITLGNTRHPFDLSSPAYHEYLKKVFRRMVDEYGARYFKLDFLAAGMKYFKEDGRVVRFPGGYCIESLRKTLQIIRDTVGPDVFMLACGAPTLAGVGILNGARMSCDIIWGKNKENPSFWTIMKGCLKTVGWRYFYNRKAYVNDPDGLVLRDWDRGDGFNCSYSEAELWAIAVAMSGGAVESNDELEKLSPARRRLYTHLLPPLGISARPVDMFQQPEPTAWVLELDENTKFLALFHFGDTMADLEFDLAKIGMSGALTADCLTGKFIGFRDTVRVENANPHSGAMFLLRRPGNEPAFAGADANIYMGVNMYSSVYQNGKLHITGPELAANVYATWPDGYRPAGETVLQENGYTLTKL